MSLMDLPYLVRDSIWRSVGIWVSQYTNDLVWEELAPLNLAST